MAMCVEICILSRWQVSGIWTNIFMYTYHKLGYGDLHDILSL